MRKSFLLSAILFIPLNGAVSAVAEEIDTRAVSPRGDVATSSVSYDAGTVFIDLMAADFFEKELRLAQSLKIEAATARRYLSLNETDRARFREDRKRIWRSLSDSERAALRGAKRPLFSNLDDRQKQTFRRIAAQELGGGQPASSRDEI